MSNENKTTIVFEGDTTQLEKDVTKSLNNIKKKADQIDYFGTGFQPDAKETFKSFKDFTGGAEKQGKELGQSFVGGFNSSWTNAAAGIFIAQQAFDAFGRAANAAFDTILEGEKLNRIEKQFNNIADSFGINGDKLSSAFIQATGGIVDDDDAIQSLTEKMVTFGGKVEKLPDLFTLARKAANLFGGNAQDTFERLSFAAQTGNTRSIRLITGVLDLDKAVEKYANTHGLVVEKLTEEEKVQIRLNTILEETSKKFKSVSVETGTVAEEWAKLKVSTDNFFEKFSRSAADMLGGPLKAMMKGISETLDPKFLNPDVTPMKNLSDAYAQEAAAMAKIQALQQDKEAAWFGVKKTKIQNEINAVTGYIAKYREFINQQELLLAAKPKENEKPKLTVYTQEDLRAIDDINKKIQDKYDQSKLALLQSQLNTNKTMENLDALSNQQQLVNMNTFENEKLAIVDGFRSKNLINEAQANAYKKQIQEGAQVSNKLINDSILLADEDFKNRKLSSERDRVAREKEIQEKANSERWAKQMMFQDGMVGAYEGYSETILDIMKKLREKQAQLMRQMAENAYNSMVNGVSKSIGKMAIAFRDHKNAAQAFGESMIATFGDIMVQMGSAYVAMAIPMFFVPGEEGRAAGMMAGGAALIMAGTLMGASVNGGDTQGLGSDTSSGGGVYGGSTSMSGSTSESITAPADAVINEPKSTVNLNVQGNILNNRESALYLAEVLEDGFRDQAIKFRGV